MALTKREKKFKDLVTPGKMLSAKEAVELVKKTASAKFDESVDIAVRLGVDPRKADQMVRGMCDLPHGTGRKVRVLVVTKGPKAADAQAAGADMVGGEEMLAKIEGGWLEFDRLVVTPDMMGAVGKLGKILGPRGLMPNPKTGTVTMDIAGAVKSIKGGQVTFRVDKAGIVHAPVGRASFSADKLGENLALLMDTLRKAKPSSAKGVYMRSLTISTTMGPGIAVDPVQFM